MMELLGQKLHDINTARRAVPGGTGTQTSALMFAGYTTTAVGNTESWDGTSWTEVNDLNTVRNETAGAGTSNFINMLWRFSSKLHC